MKISRRHLSYVVGVMKPLFERHLHCTWDYHWHKQTASWKRKGLQKRFVHIHGCTQHKQKWWTGARKIKNYDLTPEKECIVDVAAKRQQGVTRNTKPRQRVNTCDIKLYWESQTCVIHILPPTKLTNTEEDGWNDGADCTVQPLEPNNFVLLKLATKKKRRNILWGWSKNGGLMVITPDFWGSNSCVYHLVSQSLKTLK
jgi:hypothetical protein